jgi:heterotetrameric sarcosine oxidase delta subunit
LSFLIDCPNCGSRDVYEYRYGGEVRARPNPNASDEQWDAYLHVRTNLNGVQREWWYHRDGCGRWLVAERDTTCNFVVATYWMEDVNS